MSSVAFLLALDGRPASADELARLLAAQRRPANPRARTLVRGPLAATAHVAAPGLVLPPGLVLSADLRLDGRDELARELGIAPAAAAFADEDLLLLAYARWGIAAFERISGDYAFALHDPVAQRVVCAVDLLGTRALCWAQHAGRVACASSARAIVAAGLVPDARDEARILAGFAGILAAHEATRTNFVHVSRLAPGEIRVWEAGSPMPSRRGALILDASVAPGDVETHVGTLRGALERSVAERLRADGPVGAMLSGGKDSAAVVGHARALRATAGGPPLLTFSALDDDPATCPETACVLAMEGFGGLEPTHVHPRDMPRLAADVLDLLEASDEPFDATLGLAPILSMLLARRAGCLALLSGVDGDLATSIGSDLPAYALARGRPVQALRLARVAAAERGASAAGIFWREGLKRLVPRPLRALGQAVGGSERRRIEAWVRASGLREEVVGRLELRDRLRAALRRYWPDVGAFGSAPQRRHVARLESGFLPSALGAYDRLGAATGMELRHPFADLALLRALVRIPWWAKDLSGRTKGLLERASAGLVPAAVLERPPQGPNLNGPLERAFLAQAPVRAALAGACREADVAAYLRPEAAAALAVAAAPDRPSGPEAPRLLVAWAVARALRGPAVPAGPALCSDGPILKSRPR